MSKREFNSFVAEKAHLFMDDKGNEWEIMLEKNEYYHYRIIFLVNGMKIRSYGKWKKEEVLELWDKFLENIKI